MQERCARLNVSVKENKHQHFQKPNVHLAGVARKLKEKSVLSKKRNPFEELPEPAFMCLSRTGIQERPAATHLPDTSVSTM